ADSHQRAEGYPSTHTFSLSHTHTLFTDAVSTHTHTHTHSLSLFTDAVSTHTLFKYFLYSFYINVQFCTGLKPAHVCVCVCVCVCVSVCVCVGSVCVCARARV